jgi:hypothetical protein
MSQAAARDLPDAYLGFTWYENSYTLVVEDTRY